MPEQARIGGLDEKIKMRLEGIASILEEANKRLDSAAKALEELKRILEAGE